MIRVQQKKRISPTNWYWSKLFSYFKIITLCYKYICRVGQYYRQESKDIFMFENISIPAGHFSVKYIFPDDGTHQVLLRLDKGNDFKIPASFDVFVPHQSPPSILDPFPSSPGTTNGDLGIWISKILAISVPVTTIMAIIIMLKKKSKKHS